MSNITISQAFETFRLEYIVYRNQSKRTEEMSRCAMKAFIDFAGDIPVTDITFDLVRKWKEHLELTMGQNTVRGYIIKLRVVLKHLVLMGEKDMINPEIIGVPKRLRTTISFISPEGVAELIKATFAPASGYSRLNRYRNRAMISLLYASGIRCTELINLNRNILQMDNLSFTVIGKGNKPRLCFFDERTKGYLIDYLKMRDDDNPALFLSELTGRRISKSTLELVFRVASRKAGFTVPVRPHTLRHSFATQLLKANTNLVYVRDFLGHTSVSTTEMYTHVVNEDLRSIYLAKHSI